MRRNPVSAMVGMRATLNLGVAQLSIPSEARCSNRERAAGE
jgi:hypothetical protein